SQEVRRYRPRRSKKTPLSAVGKQYAASAPWKHIAISLLHSSHQLWGRMALLRGVRVWAGQSVLLVMAPFPDVHWLVADQQDPPGGGVMPPTRTFGVPERFTAT